jgi:AraC family transcriptional regulator
MSTVAKALWFIESHSSEIQSLDEVAVQVGVTPFHLTRAFSLATGHSVMRYLRARRLTEAARRLAAGASSILEVALDAGYGSHEAFSRAFRDHFGLTPEGVRERRHLENLKLVEPLDMNDHTLPKINPIRFEDGREILLAGTSVRYSCSENAGLPTRAAIPGQWQKFLPYMAHIPGQLGQSAYGACSGFDHDGTFDYLCGVQVKDFSALGKEWARLRIPPQRYAVFAHREHISSVGGTFNAIFGGWLPESGYEAVEGPQFELYGPSFDGRTGLGGLEIWLPVRKKP